jgi:uncharacterized membrane protein YfcA
MDFLYGMADHFLGGVLSLNMLLIIVIAYYFIQMRNNIRLIRKKKILEGNLEAAVNLNIQNYRFILISLISLLIGLFFIIFAWSDVYDNVPNVTSLYLNDFFFRVLFIVAISLFNSVLSALLYLINKIAIAKITAQIKST